MPFSEQHSINGDLTASLGRSGKRLVIRENPSLQVPSQPMALDDGVRRHAR
jgi:hypothetical protein